MTSQNPIQNDAKPDTTPPAEVALKDDEPDKASEIERELTDEEVAAIGGGVVINNSGNGASSKLF